MADFTGGVIDLSVENEFDNIILGASNTMTFSNSGTGGLAGKPIKVTGNFTTAIGSVITLRNGENLTPGIVSAYGGSRDLSVLPLDYALGGAGGEDWTDGGDGGSNGNGGMGHSSGANAGGTYGVFPGGHGGAGGSGAVSGGAGGGGGAGADNHGASTENVAFEVAGNVNLEGTINGNGADGTGTAGNGGKGGNGALSSIHGFGGAGGGGGAGASGGHSGNVYIFHMGTAVESTTKNLTGGVGTAGGSGGAGGTRYGSGPAQNGETGDPGGTGITGNNGLLELIIADGPPEMGVSTVTDIFAKQVMARGEVVSEAGNVITERGFCWSTSVNPTTADDTVVSSGTTGGYTEGITELLADTVYHMRAYAINSQGTSYSNDVEFRTHKDFIPLINMGG